MASFFSFSRPDTQEVDGDAGYQQPIDPWNLGVSTSTSTADTISHQRSSDDVMLSAKLPPTPEGLRPRKSIQRIREELQENNHYTHETNVSHTLPIVGEVNSDPPETLRGIHSHSSASPVRRSFTSYGRKVGPGILPSSFHRTDGSPINNSASSFYEQSMQGSNNFNDEDFDINSSMEESIFSRQRRHNLQQVAESPDLKRGSKPKTAVGALLVAMAETSTEQKNSTKLDENRYNLGVHRKRYHHHILPPRSWMDGKRLENGHLMNDYIDNDNAIRGDFNGVAHINDFDNDDNQSSMHASPSSLRRDVIPASWMDRQEQFQKDTSFTRRILNDDPSSSRLEERSIIGHSPYDFNPIMQEDFRGDPKRESIHAPRLLSLVNDNDRLNLSAISNSHHQKDFGSINTSLADTIEDEEDDYREIPMYYQALADDAPAHNIISDDVFFMTKDQNRRRDKEDLLRSTFERLEDCLDLLKEVYSMSSMENSLFLGLGKTKAGNEYYRQLEALLSELQEGASYGTQRQALLFCMSILQNTVSSSHDAADLYSKLPTSLSAYRSRPLWVPLPGFRSSLGLKEEPQSPQTIRGGDTSLFSLPSDSANDNTPHTSNVSMATTITTVVSPEKYGSSTYNQQQQDIRKTIGSLARLLYRLEETCRDLKSKIRKRSMFVESIQNIYLELLNVSSAHLKAIVNSFEMEFPEAKNLKRTVSNDEDVAASRSTPPFYSSYEKERNITQDLVARPRDSLRVNILQSDNDDIDSDNRNQSIECDLWSPTTNDMMSLRSQSEDENRSPTNNGYSELIDEQPLDDLRRTIGSFDREEAEDEREAPPSSDDRERDHRGFFPATFARRVVAQRPRKSRFWKKRFLALKNRGRQVTAE